MLLGRLLASLNCLQNLYFAYACLEIAGMIMYSQEINMPPKFMSSSFNFIKRKDIPRHIEGHPTQNERDTSKIWLEGEDIFCRDFYPLAIDIDDMPTAEILKIARQRQLEKITQPSTNGRRGSGGVHDRVHIRIPSLNVEVDESIE